LPALIPVYPGDRFGKLIFVRELPRIKSTRWAEFRCDCGNLKSVQLRKARDGKTTSCGCARGRDLQGWTQHSLRKVHAHMISRCYNPKRKGYHRYGGRGIGVCKSWRNPDSGLIVFCKWALSVAGYEPGLWLDRRDNDSNYTPSNCRFVTPTVSANNMSTNTWVRDPVSKKMRKWRLVHRERAEDGVSAKMFYSRLQRGWPVKKALTHPYSRTY
jgi:hypothetical protein